jgi:antitoxin component YwqK of YwqJK toxin-antitoxin module
MSLLSYPALAQSDLDTLEIYWGQRKYYRKDLFPKIYGCVKMKMVEFREKNPDAYYIIKYKSSNIIFEKGAYLKSMQQGEWTYYDNEGNVYEIAHYTDSVLDGKQAYFNAGGSIECIYEWEMGVQLSEECP